MEGTAYKGGKVKFGVDVGGTTIKIGLFDSQNLLLYKCELPTDKADGGANILGDVCGCIDKLLSERDIKKEDCIGAGIGLPGPVTADGRILGCVNLGWGIFNVREKLSQMLGGMRTAAGNDANLAALGEQMFGGGHGYDNVLMITMGTGVGGGVILDGQIVTGTNGAAGEIGHIPVNIYETDKCSCGKCGCLEQYASASGIVRLAKKYILEGIKSEALGEIGDITAKDIMDAAKCGDTLCLKVLDTLSTYMGVALASAASVINPDCMVIGGGVSRAGQFLLDAIEEKFRKYAFAPCANVTFRLAALGNDAGIYGCAGLL